MGTDSALAQTDYSGTYYIASDYQNPSNKVRQYNPNTLTDNYYLCPSDGWIYYKPDNDWSADGTAYPNPFLTTYKCRTDGYSQYGGIDNAKWVITKHGDYYSFYHTGTGQYMMFSGQISGCGADRMRVHLETVDGDLPDNALFTISADGRSVIIHPKTVPGDHLTVNGGNKDALTGQSGKTGGPKGTGYNYENTAGIIGIWRGNEDNNFFYLEDYITRPTIGFNASQEIEITAAQQGATIIYTTDGTTPSLSNGQTYTDSFDPQEGTTTIKAIAIVDNEASNVAVFTTPVLCGDTHKYLIQSLNNVWNDTEYHFYMIPGNDDKVNTTSLFRPTMEWYFLDAGTEGNIEYYYIVNNGNGKYLCNENKNVHMEDFSIGNKFKFSLVVLQGAYNIIPYGLTSGDRFLTKPKTNTDNSNINLSNASNANSQWKIIPSNALDKTAPFTASTDGSYSYYKIASVGTNGYYIVPGATNVTTSNTESDAMNWYFEVAQESSNSDWLTYYHIRNAVTGQYLYFTKDANDAGACLEMSSTIDPENADRYMFTWARTATQDTYYIIPKLLKDASLNDFSSLQRNNGTLQTKLSRGAGNSAWTFTTSSYTCSQPQIEWDATAGGYVITSTESDAKCYYTLGQGSLTSATGTLYTGAIDVSELGVATATIRAIAIRNSDGSDQSAQSSLTVYRVESPAIAVGDRTVQLTCATDGASIYYETDVTNPLTPSPSSSTLYDGPIGNISGNIIKAIAVKDGWINSSVVTSQTIMFTCTAPVITKTSATTFTIQTQFPDNGVSIYYTTDGSEPTTSGTLYSGAVTFSAGDVPFTVKAIAVAPGYNNSTVASMVVIEDLHQDTDGFYIISAADDYNNFIQMANGYGSGWNYKITADIDIPSGTAPVNSVFSGQLTGIIKEDGSPSVINGLDHAIFNTLDGGTVKDLILDNVNISGGTNVGAICNNATGNSRIYNCGINGGSVNGSNYVGGIAGLLDGSARVINCFSYAEIKGGSFVGGIVGWNNVATNGDQEDTDHYLKTMVMNCMFYGDITGGNNKAPIYNGQIISNKDSLGLGNYNYFLAEASYVQNNSINTYNCALMAESRFLQRFEFFRHVLNSNRELAAWYATGSTANKDQILKWVMEPGQIGTDTPYPTLKTPGRYHSVVYIDDLDVSTGKSGIIGTSLGTLTVAISMGDGGAQFGAPTGAAITTSSVTLDITDKDPDHFNYNYGKVQLPYYNDVGTNNYTGNRVVTGWKIVSITGGTQGTLTKTGSDVTFDAEGNISTMPFNFADRQCTDKDLYSVSGRVFNQGDYWDVPDGVTAITIQPYWAKAAYVSDPYYDKVYNENMTTGYDVASVGGQRYENNNSYSINGDDQKVYTSIATALADNAFKPSSSHTVYDYAVVLVGNYHQYGEINNNNSPFTVMSIDLDHDNEPDYSFMLRFDGRTLFHPARYDFLNIVGLGMAQKSTGGTGSYNLGIIQPKYWFEVTNTALFRATQFEYSPKDRVKNPIILQGGVIEQWVTQQQDAGDKVNYFLVGDNVWFKEFHRGSHQDNAGKSTPHPPVSITGGDFESFYLTGLYQSNAAIYNDDAECYISGGKFGTMAGAGMEGIGDASKNTGNIFWQIDHADIDEFYGGGINAVKPVQGNIYTIIRNSNVRQFCGGPKFGDMQEGRTVTTIADNCTFATFFGAGYGGSSYNRYAPTNQHEIMNPTSWNTWVGQEYKQEYSSEEAKNGISTRFDYQFIPQSNNINNVARLFVDFVSFSLATTRNVKSTLTGCTINGNFYGGGSLGKVDGDISSTLINCTVTGNVFGAGYSASTPTVEVMPTSGFITEPYYDKALGTFRPGVLPSKDPEIPQGQQTATYTWAHADEISIDRDNHILYTTLDLSKDNLGSVSGEVSLTITTSGQNGQSIIGTIGDPETGHVFGGGDESAVNNSDTPADAHITVTLSGNTQVLGDLFGGGNKGNVSGSTQTLLTDRNSTTGVNVNGSVYGGGNAASVGTTGRSTSATVNISGQNAVVANTVYGGCNSQGSVIGKAIVTITAGTVGTAVSQGNPIPNAVFGGGKGQPTLIEGDVEVNIGIMSDDETPEPTGSATINGSVYGGSALGNVQGTKTDVNIISGTVNGDAYGGGLGHDEEGTQNDIAANVYSSVTVTVKGGSVYDVFGCNNILGTPTKDVNVNIMGGTIGSSVYGGGNLASYLPEDPADYPMVNIMGGIITENVFGGGLGKSATVSAKTKVTLSGGTVQGSIYGGGDLADVTGMVTADINGGTVNNDVYGGGALANTNTSYYNLNATPPTITIDDDVYTTQVNLHGGTVKGDVYGGGLGQIGDSQKEDIKAFVGSTLIELNPDNADNCVVQGNIFGCNNLNGSPTGNVQVHIYKTQGWTGHDVSDAKNDDDAAKDNTVYELAAVYGGGNLADYEPLDSDTATWVIIDGCGETSIQKVYGGGNAASTPATNVTVNGTFEIGELFGGGNGKDRITVNGTEKENPGAHVGYKAYPDDATDLSGYIYGSGRTRVTVYGGTIHSVYGGSDTKGNVRYLAITMLDGEEVPGRPHCKFDVSHIYGGGKNAPMDGQVIMKMDCIPGLNTVYGGAENADVNGDVVLNITNGEYRQVFGGNNVGGQVNGSITINIEETGCQPIIIGELYGGGRNAPYSIYGYKYEGSGDNKVLKPRTSLDDEGTGPDTAIDDPQVNIKSFTSIGNVYGGGFGRDAVMVGNPHVNINVGYGAYYDSDLGVFAGDTIHIDNEDDDTFTVVKLPAHEKGNIGTINTVYGGGNAADVIGDTYVNIGTETEVDLISTGQKLTVQGAVIEENVYGGGNKAHITGSTNIQLGK